MNQQAQAVADHLHASLPAVLANRALPVLARVQLARRGNGGRAAATSTAPRAAGTRAHAMPAGEQAHGLGRGADAMAEAIVEADKRLCDSEASGAFACLCAAVHCAAHSGCDACDAVTCAIPSPARAHLTPHPSPTRNVRPASPSPRAVATRCAAGRADVALSGAAACSVVLVGRTVWVANVGNCRCVVGRQHQNQQRCARHACPAPWLRATIRTRVAGPSTSLQLVVSCVCACVRKRYVVQARSPGHEL